MKGNVKVVNNMLVTVSHTCCNMKSEGPGNERGGIFIILRKGPLILSSSVQLILV